MIYVSIDRYAADYSNEIKVTANIIVEPEVSNR